MPNQTKYYTESDHFFAYHVHVTIAKTGIKITDSDYKLLALSRKIKRSRDSWSRKIMNFDHIRDGGTQTGNADDVYKKFKQEYDKDPSLSIKKAASEIEPISEKARSLFIKLQIPESIIQAANQNPRPVYFGVISKGDINNAATFIDKGKIIEGFNDSTTYDVIIDKKNYPPKLLIALAYKIASDIELKASDFEGGIGTQCFQILNELGYNPELKKVQNKFVDELNSQMNNTYSKILNSISSKPFTIIAGGTGTGKTRAARQLAIQIAGVENVATVAVGSDWTDNRPLLGFRNLLSSDGKSYVVPAALKLILKANTNLREAENSAKMGDLPKGPNNQIEPYFLILDEMNLSHVERYFADFLSSMESHEPLKLHDCIEGLKSDGTNDVVPHEVAWPKNLFIIGTVNIDETTYMFSPKVLDRAHVIEFKVPWDEIKEGLSSPPVKSLPRWETSKTISFINIALNKDKSLESQNQEKLLNVLENLYECLEGTRFNFAHRTARECLNYVATSIELSDAKLAEVEYLITLIDLAILQKALPKINGSTGSLSNVLEALVLFSNKHKLTNCETKLKSMREQLKSDQFVSFIQ